MPLFTQEIDILTQPITVDGSGVTQPVSGTVTANAGTGTFTVDGSGVTQPISAASLPLPAGAATEATLAAVDGKLPATLGQKAMAASFAVAIASDQSAIPVTFTPGALTTTATVSTVAVSTTVATLSASNTGKTGVVIHNEAGRLYVKLGSGASTSDYSYRLTANTTLEINNYAGEITGIKQSGSTNAQVTEIGI